MSLEKSRSIEAQLQTISIPDTNESKELKQVSLCTKLKIILTNITVEPVMLCYVLPSVMASVTTQNLTLEKGCRVNLGLDKEICDALSIRNVSYPGYEQSEQAVQTLAAKIAIWKNIIQSVIPSLMLLFLGSWSDRHNRRKPCILFPILGEITSCVCFLICTYWFFELPLEVNAVAEALPPALTGGWFSMFMGVFSYIGGVSTVEHRTVRIGAVNMFMNISICIGIALSGILYEQIGFYGVYLLALAMYFSGYFYGVLYVKDINEIEKEKGIVADKPEVKKKNFFVDFFDIRHISQTVHVAFKNGKRNRRARVCVLIVLVMVIIGPMHGEMNVFYYFVTYRFGWNSVEYSVFSTFQFVLNTLGTIFSLAFFSGFLKIDDAMLGIISSSSKIFAAAIYAFAPTPLLFYCGAIAEMLNGTSFIAMRAIVSKLVLPEELGKVNSVYGVAEAIIPLIYGPLYSTVYYRTIEIFPGAFFLVGAILTVPALFIFFWLYLEHKKDQREDELLKMQEEKLLNSHKEANLENA